MITVSVTQSITQFRTQTFPFPLPFLAFLIFAFAAAPVAADIIVGEQTSSIKSGTALKDRPSYHPVTEERLRKPEPRNWLMYRGTYDSQGYSELDQINTGNVKHLRHHWTFSTGMREAHQAPPIINDGYMFITTPHNHLLALNAKTGELLWRYERELPEDLAQMHPTNREIGRAHV